MDIFQKTAVVTGASSGIGTAIALDLARAGASVVLAARRIKRLQELATLIQTTTESKALAVEADIANQSDIDELMSAATSGFGPVDILINNAGLGYFAPVHELDMQQVDHVLRVNLIGAMLCTKAVLPSMMERRTGTIINILSIAAKNGVKNGSAYAASKFALRGFAESLFMEVRQYNIRVINICPGSVATEFFDQAGYQHPNIEKALHPEDIAAAVMTALSLGQHANISELEIRPTNP